MRSGGRWTCCSAASDAAGGATRRPDDSSRRLPSRSIPHHRRDRTRREPRPPAPHPPPLGDATDLHGPGDDGLFVTELLRETPAVNVAPRLSRVDIGTGEDVFVAELGGRPGCIRFDTTKPDGTPRKLLDVSRLAGMGWRARTPLERGLRETCEEIVRNREELHAWKIKKR